MKSESSARRIFSIGLLLVAAIFCGAGTVSKVEAQAPRGSAKKAEWNPAKLAS